MIARVWSGRTRAEDAEVYLRYVERTGVKDQLRAPGNRGTWLLQRRHGDEVELQVLSLWESEAAIEAFAGVETDKAVYYPEDERFLLEMSPGVTHYEIVGQFGDSTIGDSTIGDSQLGDDSA